jgi:glutathione S-transferase
MSNENGMTAVLYGLSRSVYTRIARLALEEKGAGYTLDEVEIFGPAGVPAAHLRRHPFGRVPVLHHDGFTLYETGAITRYVDEAFAGPPLQPAAPRARARMSQVISLMDDYAYRPMVWDVFVQRVSVPLEGGTPDEASIARALPVIESSLCALEDLLGGQPYFAGEQLTLADLHAAPMLLYFTLTAEGVRMIERHAAVHRWLQQMRTRPSIAATRSVHEG